MRTLALSLLFFAAASAFAADATNDALKVTVQDLMTVIAVKDQGQRAIGLCKLANDDVDNAAIAPQLLGSFANLPSDQAGIAAFTALVPSLIVTDFYSLLSDKAGASYSVDTNPIPKGSNKVAYRVNIGGSNYNVTMSKLTNKVLDVEFFGISLIKTKSGDYQSKLQQKSRSSQTPVTDLVNELIGKGDLVKCN